MDREFVEYENDEGATVFAHRVTPDTEGIVTLVGGGGRDVLTGEVLVQSQNTNMYDVYSGREFDTMFPNRADGIEEERHYNPSDYTAKDVKAYLERVLGTDPEEYERVAALERAGRNRRGAIPVA